MKETLVALAILLIPFGIAILLVAFIAETSQFVFYGGVAKEEELDIFFGKHLDEYSRLTSKNQFFGGSNPIITTTTFPSLLCKWYIFDTGVNYGVIPRWSKWHKVLNEKHDKLYKKEPKKTLTNI